jgi:predicted HTH domain antitoxin
MKTEIEVIARLLQSTNTQKRPFNLIEVAEDIDWLSKHLGSLDKVSEILSVSEGMLSQFLRVKNIDSSIIEFIKNRKIDSVAIVQNLAKFSAFDQKEIANLLLEEKLTGKDIRLLNPLRRQYPNETIISLIEKLKESENKRVSVIEFDTEDLHKDISNLQLEIGRIIGIEELVSVNVRGKDGFIRITPKGEQKLRKAAKINRKTLQDFTYSILQ